MGDNFIRRYQRLLSLMVAFGLSICLSIGLSRAMAMDGGVTTTLAATAEYQWNLPDWTPKPVVPDDNPMTASKVELGRHL
ncbi:MAG: hypothetical protein AAFO85_13550, partial [Cyanobacteria bacterium J06598_4]